jgi:phosphatidylglycerol---prolipoprotein diacylglyceryl transferase
VHPDLIRTAHFHLATYGFLVAMGMLLGLTIILRLSKKQNLDSDEMWNLCGLVILAGIIGSKALYIITDWGYYSANPREIFSLSTLQAGGVFSGGLVLALITAIWYLRKHKISFLSAADVIAPGLALGHSIGRLGCFAAGCCYGKPTDAPWGVVFTNPLAREITGTPLGVKLHPTQIYEAIAELINFVVLYWIATRKKFEGQVIGLYMVVYGIERYVIEFFRDDPGRGNVWGVMSGTQLISVGLVIAGGILWMVRFPLRAPAKAAAHS